MIIKKHKGNCSDRIRYLEISGPLVLEDGDTNEWIILLNKILRSLFADKRTIKRAVISSFIKDDLFCGMTLDISKLSRAQMQKYHIDDIASGKIHPKKCIFCGCHYLAMFPYTFRGIDGCVGRSYECTNCRSLSDKTVCRVYEWQKKIGTEKVRKFQEWLFLFDDLIHKRKHNFKTTKG